jgi:hypothetical protein
MNMAHRAATAALLLLPLTAGSEEDWQFQAVIYGYLPTISGETTFSDGSDEDGGVGVDADAILENLKFAFMGSFIASKGPWGAFADVVYADIGTTRSKTRALTIAGDRIPADASAKVEFDLKGWCWTLVGTYAVAERPHATLQALGGVRMLDLSEDLTWRVSGNVGSIPIEAREGRTGSSLENWDLVVGARGRVTFGNEDRWFVPYYVDLGAGDSDFTWQALGGLGYTFGWGDVVAAYRHVDYDMKSGGDIESVSFSGPAVGVAFRW